MWQTGTATDYKDLLNKLVEIATGSHLSAISINAAGTGYTVNDVLTVSGGTSTFAAKIRVTTVGGGGDITGAVIQEGGAYTSTPSSPVSVTGGTGSSATFTSTFAATGWTAVRRTQQAASATIAGGGTGYANGNVLTVVGGNFTTAATFTVTGNSSGVITSVSLTTAGEYRDVPTNPVTVTGGAGTGATLTVTFAPYSGANEREVVLQGIGGGADTIYVGMKSYNTLGSNGLDTTYNWTLVGMTGFNPALSLDQQPGVSPGAIPSATTGAYLPLHNNPSFPIGFWFSITGRRIVGICKVENAIVTHYPSFHLGWLNQFGTQGEFPYPMYVAGGSSRHDVLFNTTAPSITGLTEAVGISGHTGPGWWRSADSVWHEVKNSTAVDSGSPTRAVSSAYVVYPCGLTSNAFTPAADAIVGNGNGDWDEFIPQAGIPGSATLRLQPTPMTGGDLYLLVPATLITTASASELDVLGEIDGVFWVSGVGGVISGDTMTVAGQRYRVFQCGNRTTEFSFMAVKEA